MHWVITQLNSQQKEKKKNTAMYHKMYLKIPSPSVFFVDLTLHPHRVMILFDQDLLVLVLLPDGFSDLLRDRLFARMR
jgi:hypothetical protein